MVFQVSNIHPIKNQDQQLKEKEKKKKSQQNEIGERKVQEKQLTMA